MSAATFRRCGKLEQSLVAIEESETLDPDNEDTWVQLGLYHLATQNTESALAAFTKAVLLQPDYTPGVVGLATVYLGMGKFDLASGMLRALVKGQGWDCVEAWWALARVWAGLERVEAELECLERVEELARGRPVREWRVAVDRWL
jgi:tetratricopeptide (TPR) repeat protein